MPRRLLILGILVFAVILFGVAAFVIIRSKFGFGWNWQTYRSVKYGYSIKFPKDWTVDTSQRDEPADLFKSPDGKAIVTVQFITDKRLLDEDGEKKVLSSIKKIFEKDTTVSLSTFESRFDGGTTPATVSGFFAGGARKYKNAFWSFIEYGVPLGDDTMSVFSGFIQEGEADKYGSIVKGISKFYDPLAARVEAINLVKSRKEVKDYVDRLSKVGKKTTFSVSDDDGVWLIQVYEIVDDGDGHTATFNWYRVNKETKEISKEFETNGGL